MEKNAEDPQASPACDSIETPYHLTSFQLGWMTYSALWELMENMHPTR